MYLCVCVRARARHIVARIMLIWVKEYTVIYSLNSFTKISMIQALMVCQGVGVRKILATLMKTLSYLPPYSILFNKVHYTCCTSAVDKEIF